MKDFVWRAVVIVLFALAVGVVDAVVSWVTGFTYAGNTPMAVIAHQVATLMLGMLSFPVLRALGFIRWFDR